MDSLYTLCQGWARFAPEECHNARGAISLNYPNDGKEIALIWRSHFDELPQSAGRTVFEAVCYQLEKRLTEQDYWMAYFDKPTGYFTSIAAASGKEAIQRQVFSSEGSTPAHALLGAYVEYLKGQNQ